MTDESDTSIWIRTQADLDGTFRLVLELGPDQSVHLDREGAVAHCDYLLNRIASATMQAKIFKQLKDINGGDEKAVAGAAAIIQDYRKNEAVPEQPTPLGARAAVNQKGHPFLVMSVRDQEIGQWDLESAKDHAIHVMMSVHVADNDQLYLTLLRNEVGLDEGTARGVVSALADIDV